MKAQGFTKETINQLGIKAQNFTGFRVGDAVAVSLKIKEGDKERLQVFEGDVIAMNNNGASSTITVRKIGANSVAVERIFPLQSPVIESITFVRSGQVRRAKLYYMRGRVGKAARVKERIMTKEEKERSVASRSTKS